MELIIANIDALSQVRKTDIRSHTSQDGRVKQNAPVTPEERSWEIRPSKMLTLATVFGPQPTEGADREGGNQNCQAYDFSGSEGYKSSQTPTCTYL